MAAIAPIVINDGQATPVAHTFSPSRIENGVTTFVDRSGGIALGFPTISHSLRQPSKGNRNYKLVVKVVVPVLEATSPSTSTGIQPAPTKAYDVFGTLEMVLPERSTTAQRKDVAAYIRNLMAHSVVFNSVEILEGQY